MVVLDMSKIFTSYNDVVKTIYPILDMRKDLEPIRKHIEEAIHQLFNPASRKKINSMSSGRAVEKPYLYYLDEMPYNGICLPKAREEYQFPYFFQIELGDGNSLPLLTVEILNETMFAEYRETKLEGI